jgi:hypothetical protein
MPNVLLPTAYLPPIQYYSKLIAHPEIIIEHFEHFPKQTYRNRTYIYSPNGKQLLVVPLKSRSERIITKDIRISYNDPWQNLHWRSMEAAYRRSPFFEFYEDDLVPFYNQKKFEFLIDLNMAMIEFINSLLKIKMKHTATSSYEKNHDNIVDLRTLLSPKKELNTDTSFKTKEYAQVFSTKHGFIPNLSVIDLLFNHGPRAVEYF